MSELSRRGALASLFALPMAASVTAKAALVSASDTRASANIGFTVKELYGQTRSPLMVARGEYLTVAAIRKAEGLPSLEEVIAEADAMGDES